LDFKEPPTAVGGISGRRSRCVRRWDFKEPPTPVGGISESVLRLAVDGTLKNHQLPLVEFPECARVALGKWDLNEPSTAVGGISLSCE